MIITRTPFRISFVGGGSDLPAYFQKNTGAVISASINKYMYISSHSFFNQNEIRVKYSQTETVNDIEAIKHPIFREVLKEINLRGAVEISSNADVPSGTGLGSSSSFTVGLLHNLYTRQRKILSPSLLAEMACMIEIDRIKDPIGKQDQYAAAIGGLNLFTFRGNGHVDIEPLLLETDFYKEFEDSLLLFYTGKSRRAADILVDQRENLENQDKINVMGQMVDLVWEFKNQLFKSNLERLGKILNESWLLKKSLSTKISNEEIDEMYSTSLKNGAFGGKLLGAGGSGFMLFCCPKERQPKLREALKKFKEMPFSFTQEGSRLIHIDNE